ncbi:MAG: hypothetical protein GTO22_14445 [Gemmatimonadales bacterium]|nr:hypothetical protein [Gemmatimonadales bacterium]
MNDSEALAVVAYVQAAWPSWRPHEGTARIWAGGLKRFERDHVLAAVDKLVAGSSRPPTLGEIIDATRHTLRTDETRQLSAPKPKPLSAGRTEMLFNAACVVALHIQAGELDANDAAACDQLFDRAMATDIDQLRRIRKRIEEVVADQRPPPYEFTAPSGQRKTARPPKKIPVTRYLELFR